MLESKRKDIHILANVFVQEIGKGEIKSALAAMDIRYAGELLINLVALKNGDIDELNLYAEVHTYPPSVRLVYRPDLEHNDIKAVSGGSKNETIVFFSIRTVSLDAWIRRLSAFLSFGKPYGIVNKKYKVPGGPELTIGTYAKTM